MRRRVFDFPPTLWFNAAQQPPPAGVFHRTSTKVPTTYDGSSAGRAADSKSAGRGFDPPPSCFFFFSLSEGIMSLSMYKPGQGYWTRVLTAAGAMALAAGCAQWIASHWFHENPKAVATTWGLALAGTALAMWIVLNRPRVVDFMIATETEMKKVSWPTRKTLVVLTSVVIGALLGLAVLVSGIDAAFQLLFRLIHIL